jgi:hypothetical protein
MIEDLITIIEKIREKIKDGSAMEWTGYDSAKSLRNELEIYIDQLKKGNTECLEDLNTHFLPTATFQDHSISNGWGDEYMSLAEQFDRIYSGIKKPG